MHHRRLPCFAPRVEGLVFSVECQNSTWSSWSLNTQRSALNSLRYFRFLKPIVELFAFWSELAGHVAPGHFDGHLRRQVIRKTDDRNRDQPEERRLGIAEGFHPRRRSEERRVGKDGGS